jgi:adenine/guanine phosphoribosyltransferase-like PRPP-binding protein
MKKKIKMIMKVLKTYDFDAFAFRGMSGALIAPVLAMLCGKSLIMVRKMKEDGSKSDCHSKERVEGDLSATKYIIVDDFISSGQTITNIIQEISHLNPSAICIGALLYNDPLKYGCKFGYLYNVFRHTPAELKRFAAKDPETYKIRNEK